MFENKKEVEDYIAAGGDIGNLHSFDPLDVELETTKMWTGGSDSNNSSGSSGLGMVIVAIGLMLLL